MRTQIQRLNREIFTWPETHPARRFLEAFILCRKECVGCELPRQDVRRCTIDQEWTSAIDGRRWSFSDFAYEFLSVDLVLDGWLSRSPALTESERLHVHRIPALRQLMRECEMAAMRNGNEQVVVLTQHVLDVLELWEQCIHYRVSAVSG